MPRRDEIRYLGFGTLFAAYMTAIWRVGSPASGIEKLSSSFFAGCSLGMVMIGVLTVFLGLALRRTLHPTSTSPTLRLSSETVLVFTALAFAVVGLMGQAYGTGSNFTNAINVAAGAAFGGGILLLALVWTAIYSSLSFIDALKMGSLATLLGIALATIGQWIPEGFPVALYVVALAMTCAITAVLALQGVHAAQSSAAEQTPEKQASNLPSSATRPYPTCKNANKTTKTRTGVEPHKNEGSLGWPHRLATLLRPSWAPLCGLGICAFLLGLLWAQEIPLWSAEASGSRAFLGNAGFIGPLLVSLGMAFASRRICDYADAKRFFWIVMPIVAAFFVITPLFDDIGSVEWNVLVVNLQNGGSVALAVCTWSLLLASSRASGVSTYATFGGCLAFVSGMSLAGFVVFHGVGTAANVVAIVMFVAYLCATVVFLVVEGPEEQAARKQEDNIVESYIKNRCRTIVDAYALTPREAEILVLLSRGHSYGFIAESVYISEATVRTHARNIYRKMGISSQEDLLNYIDAL